MPAGFQTELQYLWDREFAVLRPEPAGNGSASAPRTDCPLELVEPYAFVAAMVNGYYHGDLSILYQYRGPSCSVPHGFSISDLLNRRNTSLCF